ncbi:unnamed protein product [Spirodela intermedia]|uniref:Uncharacterized protein n=1 Tax=Spirodela intermedia TaxID=51605 RepID=A0A7I8K5V0_SPIIN|nr:unnamed protein product [Spirodela intermedia]
MGDVRDSPPRENGVLAGDAPPLALESRSLNPHPSKIGADSWRLAEQAVEGIIQRIQPTRVTDQRRRQVVEYVRNLIKGVAYAEIFPFGSVPLKTYLPDGDIDLTAIEPPRSEEYLAKDVLNVLQAEEQNRNSPFEVKDVQYIHAEVKLVKCLVQNIVVDISFQQVGGLCTLCFLEKVDRIIGKNHLFKRSIILIKAWCYYESRILGAHHGLISTYALETLVLYIFHVFHPSLDGPLAVLYRFLDYFSQFDWDNYCVSLNGPVRLTSLPDTPPKPTEADGADLLLSRDFLKKCEDEFASAFRWSDNASNPRLFHRKHLNIIDPLKANNNLGRSVNKGNFYRIRSAFTFGARKLGRILTLPEERTAEELNKFFTNTLDRHDSAERSDTHCLSSGSGEFDSISLEYGVQRNPKRDTEDPPASSSATLDFRGGLFEDIVKLRISELGDQRPPFNQFAGNGTEDHSISGISPAGDSKSDVGGSGAPENEAGDSSSPKIHRSSGKPDGNVLCGEPSEVPEAVAPNGEGFEPSDLSDLTGDYNSYMRNLLCAVGCLERHPPAYPFYSNHGRDAQQMNLFPHMNAGGIVARPFSPAGYYPLGAATFIPGAYALEDVPRTRGTGTYFPNVSHWTHREKRLPGRGRSQPHLGQQTMMPRPWNNSRHMAVAAGEKANGDKFVQVQLPHSNGGYARRRPAQLDVPPQQQQQQQPSSSSNPLLENEFEFGSLGNIKVAAVAAAAPAGTPPPETSLPDGEKLKESSANERSGQAYHLKNEEDFPPLGGGLVQWNR